MIAPNPLTVAWVESQVQFIREMSRDDEAAHSEEDALHLCVLAAIANGTTADPAAVAAAALKTQDISFSRWCS